MTLTVLPAYVDSRNLLATSAGAMGFLRAANALAQRSVDRLKTQCMAQHSCRALVDLMEDIVPQL